MTKRKELDILISDLEFSVRTMHCFEKEGIVTVRDLVINSEAELKRIPNFGRKSLNEVKMVLYGLGLELRKHLIFDTEEKMAHAIARARSAKNAYEEALREVQRIAKLIVDMPLPDSENTSAPDVSGLGGAQ